LILTGYPTRPDLAKWTRTDARQTLGLTNDVPVLLVLGGSKGARSINNAVLANLPAILENVQLLHITGDLDWPAVEVRVKELNKTHSTNYHAFPYLHDEMGAALAAADLVLSRAGASTLGEYPLFGLPAVLVPYPYAWHYQKVNADALVKHGAAVLLDDDKLSSQLLPTVIDLFNQPQKLASMRTAMKSLSHPEAALEISHQIFALCQERI
jgi:UDP-N-acetylglucosamine--N-acetylmuramyl-(pentapeptide) pyrophosphoryl-undecaprenol N-acetylglucosamine transferase